MSKKSAILISIMADKAGSSLNQPTRTKGNHTPLRSVSGSSTVAEMQLYVHMSCGTKVPILQHNEYLCKQKIGHTSESCF